MAEATSNLAIVIKARDEASGALSRLSGDVSELGGQMNFAGLKAGILAGALSAIAGAAVLSSIKAFAESEVQMARFEAIVKTLPPHLQTFRDRILEVADSALTLGFDNEAAALSLAKLFQATGDAQFSFQAFQAAMDLARYKGIGLEEATQALVLAFQGGGRMLKQFGIEVDDHASKQTILAAVFDKVRGQSEAYSQTLQGQWEIMKAMGGEIMEALGKPFAEALKLIFGWVIKWTEAHGGINKVLEDHKTIILLVAGALAGVLVLAFGAAVVAAVAAGAAWLGLTAVAIAVAAVIGAFAAYVVSNWNRIKDGALYAADAIRNAWFNVWSSITGFVSSSVSSIVGMIDRILNAVERLKDLVRSGVASGLNSAQSGVLNVVQKILNFLPFAEGGIVTRPTLGLVGEAGAEAIIPLNRLGSAGLGGGMVINLQGDFYTDIDVAEHWANQIARIIRFQLKL